ncbi:MAG: response regulator [Vulcanimicrobiota bacterium]
MTSILVVEDDHEMQNILVETLEDEGYVVHGVDSVAQALKAVENTVFEILVTDVRMAEINGVEGFRLLKERLPDLRCIVVTGYSTREVTEEAIQLKVDDFICKPFPLSALTRSVRRVVELNSLSNHYLAILKRIPAGLVSTAIRFFKKEDKVKLDEARRDCFQALHLGIRSTHLNAYSANRIFFDLVGFDAPHKAYLLDPSPEVAAALLKKYGYLYEILKGLLKDEKTQYAGNGAFPSSIFGKLYQGIQEGGVTLEELQVAAALHDLGTGELLQAPEFLKLRETVWGAAT